MHKALHARDDVDRLYVSKKEGGGGLASIEESVDASIQWHEDYIEMHERGLIIAIKNNTDNTVDNRMTITRKQKWKEKQLYGRFKRLINNISPPQKKNWIWLKKWTRWSIGRCASNLNLIIRMNSIFTTEHQSLGMTQIYLYGTLTWKPIT